LSSIVSRAQEWGVGFSYIVGMGNEANIDLTDCLRFMVEDPHTEVIMALIEGIRDVRKFSVVANLALEKRKPIIVLKLGASDAGRKCAATHTGNLAGAYPIYLGSFRQKRVLLASGIDDFILSARTLLHSPLPEGDGIGVVTTSGGGAGMISDVIQSEGLRLGNLSAQSIQKLAAVMPWYGTPKNPLDFAGQKDPSVARRVYQTFLQDSGIHILLFVVHTQSNKETFINELSEAGKKFKKPIFVLYLGGTLAPAMDGLMSSEDLPFFVSPRECIKAIGTLICYSRYLKKTDDISSPNESLITAKERALKIMRKSEQHITEENKEKLLSCYGIRSVRQKIASTSEGVLRIASSFGYPVALKIASPDILHKTEFKGVELNIQNSTELKKVYKRMYARFYKDTPDLDIQGILVQEMVTDQVAEVIVGITRDPQFGPTIMFGLGGIMTELLEDVSFRICPLSLSDAREMIREIKGYRVLDAFRGKPKADVAALEKALVRLSHLAVDLSESIHEIEINPLMVFAEGKGVRAADTTFLLR
jgi:acyl-CoA synthetase (NDP forming)